MERYFSSLGARAILPRYVNNVLKHVVLSAEVSMNVFLMSTKCFLSN